MAKLKYLKRIQTWLSQKVTFHSPSEGTLFSFFKNVRIYLFFFIIRYPHKAGTESRSFPAGHYSWATLEIAPSSSVCLLHSNSNYLVMQNANKTALVLFCFCTAPGKISHFFLLFSLLPFSVSPICLCKTVTSQKCDRAWREMIKWVRPSDLQCFWKDSEESCSILSLPCLILFFPRSTTTFPPSPLPSCYLLARTLLFPSLHLFHHHMTFSLVVVVVGAPAKTHKLKD